METVGQRVVALRKRIGLSQEELGEKIGLTKGGVSAIENGKSHSQETLTKVASLFNVELNWLITGEGEKPKGLVMASKKSVIEEPWKDEAYQIMKEELAFYKEIIRNLTGGKHPGNFLQALTNARATMAKVVDINYTGPGAQVGAEAA